MAPRLLFAVLFLSALFAGCFAVKDLDEQGLFGKNDAGSGGDTDGDSDSDGDADAGRDAGPVDIGCDGDEDCSDGFACDRAASKCFGPDCAGEDAKCAVGRFCADEGACLDKKENGTACGALQECVSDWCADGLCCPAGDCCADQGDCGASAPVCSSQHQCVACGVEDLCAAQYPATPACNAGTGQCAECAEDADCRVIDGGVAPFNSPLGLCTPDGTCTCWVESETWKCTTAGDCGSGYFCARDSLTAAHDVCLRGCASATSASNGIACAVRSTVTVPALVWVPATTCYAYDKLWDTCPATECSANTDGGISDGFCVAGRCTYECAVAEDCPAGYECGSSAPYSDLCKPIP